MPESTQTLRSPRSPRSPHAKDPPRSPRAKEAKESSSPRASPLGVPKLSISTAASNSGGLISSRVSTHTPRACQHTPRLKSTWEAGGCLGEPFLLSHASQIYFNHRADMPDEVVNTPRAKSHLPAAYAVIRKLLSEEDVARAAQMMLKPVERAPSPADPFIVHKFTKSIPTLKRALPFLFDRVCGARGGWPLPAGCARSTPTLTMLLIATPPRPPLQHYETRSAGTSIWMPTR